jgi:hypothetical protein
MAVAHTYPGIYVQEINGVGSIVGVSTSDTVFIDFFPQGPVGVATRITSFDVFSRTFGGLDERSEASYAIQQFFLNGGAVAWVVRVVATAATSASGDAAVAASLVINNTSGTTTAVLDATAASVGAWGGATTNPTTQLQIGIDSQGPSGNTTLKDNTSSFNMVVRLVLLATSGQTTVIQQEVYRGVNLNPASGQYVVTLVNAQSSLVTLTNPNPAATLAPTVPAGRTINGVTGPQDVINSANTSTFFTFGGGLDGDAPGWTGSGSDLTTTWAKSTGAAILNTGFAALNRMAPFTFSILCIPAAAELATTSAMEAVYSTALAVCQTFRAFLIVDIPRLGASVTGSSGTVSFTDATSFMNTWYGDANIQTLFGQGVGDHAAVYFPRLQVPDALNNFNQRTVAASGTVAGIFSRTDANRGVWKAPAGTDASLVNATVGVTPSTGLPVNLTDQENGALNPFGVNAIRNFPVFGTIVWGARTLNGADAAASQWKYVPVRRIALYIEESLVQGSKWIVFEPNDEPLWAEIRKTFTSFMQSLFLQGAFQGSSPSQAYFVRCDSSTTTQTDIDNGVVNILVGFAPLKPAEFVVISIQQFAGQTTT